MRLWWDCDENCTTFTPFYDLFAPYSHHILTILSGDISFLTISGFIMGYTVCGVVLRVVSSAVCTIFVCFAKVWKFWWRNCDEMTNMMMRWWDDDLILSLRIGLHSLQHTPLSTTSSPPPGGPIMEMRWELVELINHQLVVRRGCGCDVDEMWMRCGWDVDEMWMRWWWDVDGMWMRCGWDMDEMTMCCRNVRKGEEWGWHDEGSHRIYGWDWGD